MTRLRSALDTVSAASSSAMCSSAAGSQPEGVFGISADTDTVTLYCGDASSIAEACMPNRPAVQAAFIEERIRPLAAGQTHLVLAGDFNFVESPRDRARSEGPLKWRDRTPAAAMAALVEDSPLRDAFRLIHPMQRGYTFSAYNAQARFDRLYVSMALVPRVFGCDAGESGGSDHRVVAMHLSPLVPESRGPGRPRVRAHFWADRDLADGFRAWFGREAAGAPTHGHTELMRWWQAFKPRLAREARRLDCDLGRRRDAVSVEVTRLRADLQRARAAVEAGRDGLAELAGLYALQRRLDVAVRRYAAAPPACVRPGERVSGGMAAAFRKPAAARRVAALRDARGILVTDGRGMADIMADAVAAVSRPPPPSPADREAVLGAVRAHSPRVPQAVADAAGALVVTPAEVRAAATHSKPGTAPGPDGIPVDVWRKLGEPAFELLAAVFTAVGATGGTPPGFLDGVVASIYKAKNAADAANYRPLTMLGSDYRILAKVLATRWTPLLSAVVGPEQTAFLAGRRISDNICLTQMLPGLLAANAAEGVGPTGAALALLDFRKAYDTIDRGFLIAVMEAVGVGDGVLAWTRTILTHTYASAEVNGFISAPRKYAAGVRQGCPAAPALFLFLGHALACFLRTCPAVGVEVVPGCRVTCPQYADDCMPLLRSCAPADVAALVETMAVFGRATGLVLNLGKCGILPLGSAGEGLLAGAEVAGLRVLDAGVSLGVPVSAGLPPPEGVTGVCRERLAAAYTKLARFPMSAFGRGHAAATYGVSRILFRAVHCGMTPEAERVLSRWTATLVDRSVGPDPPAELPRWASSVPAELWGAEAPLWANPLLQLELPAAQRSVQWREPTGDAAGHALFSPTDAARWLVDGLARVRDALPGMRTVTDLCVLWAWLAAVDMVFAGPRGLEAAVPTLWRMPLLNARKEPIWRLWIFGMFNGDKACFWFMNNDAFFTEIGIELTPDSCTVPCDVNAVTYQYGNCGGNTSVELFQIGAIKVDPGAPGVQNPGVQRPPEAPEVGGGLDANEPYPCLKFGPDGDPCPVLGTFCNATTELCDFCGIGQYLVADYDPASPDAVPECRTCAPGYYTDHPGAMECTPCGCGYDASALSEFPAASFPADSPLAPANFVCIQCPGGTYGFNGTCTECGAGSYSLPGSCNCTECDVGSASSEAVMTMCPPCTAGTYAATTGQEVCDTCPDGTLSLYGSGGCYTQAPDVTIIVEGITGATGRRLKATVCDLLLNISGPNSILLFKDCAETSASASLIVADRASHATSYVMDDQVIKVLMAAGYDKPDDVLCGPGLWSPNAKVLSICRPCPAETTSPAKSTSNTSCSPCGSDFSTNGAVGQGTCNFCAAGHYGNPAVGIDCQPCRYGTYTVKPGQAKCDHCPASTFASEVLEDAGGCIECALGTDNSNMGATECDPCQRGRYSNGTGAAECGRCPEDIDKCPAADAGVKASCKLLCNITCYIDKEVPPANVYARIEEQGLKDEFDAALSALQADCYEYTVDVPAYANGTEISNASVFEVMMYIKAKVTEIRNPFCWRKTYDRGIGHLPGRMADCPAGYTNNGLTWQDCSSTMIDCGAGCAESSLECGLTVFNQVFSIVVLASNIATFGGAGSVDNAIDGATTAVKVGTKANQVAKTATATSKLGKFSLKFLDKMAKYTTKFANQLQTICPGGICAQSPTYLKKLKMGLFGTKIKTAKTAATFGSLVYDAQAAFQASFQEDFVDMTTQEVYDQLDTHYDPVTRDHMMSQWALIEADQMAAALGWTIADVTLAVGAIIDPTGVVDLAAAYIKPVCPEVSESACTRRAH
ncbi:hypothetical protein FOA52_013355 [Chlamydomonas sp. UWO 241]|nr:hypothetical protein FOA52_013355 [Chlamydomonas sp. UWO 241]